MPEETTHSASGLVRAEISDEDLESFLHDDYAASRRIVRHTQWMVTAQVGSELAHAKGEILSMTLERVWKDARRLARDFLDAASIRRRDEDPLEAILTVPLRTIIGCKASVFIFQRVLWCVRDYAKRHRRDTVRLRTQHDESPCVWPNPEKACELQRIMDSLATGDIALLYYKIEGLTFPEMEPLLKDNADALRQRYHRITARLRASFPELCRGTKEKEVAQ